MSVRVTVEKVWKTTKGIQHQNRKKKKKRKKNTK